MRLPQIVRGVNGGDGSVPISLRPMSSTEPQRKATAQQGGPAGSRAGGARVEPGGIEAAGRPPSIAACSGCSRVGERGQQAPVAVRAADVLRWAGALALQAHRVPLVRVGGHTSSTTRSCSHQSPKSYV